MSSLVPDEALYDTGESTKNAVVFRSTTNPVSKPSSTRSCRWTSGSLNDDGRKLRAVVVTRNTVQVASIEPLGVALALMAGLAPSYSHVKPKTVIAWHQHRLGFRLVWTWKNPLGTGRPGVPTRRSCPDSRDVRGNTGAPPSLKPGPVLGSPPEQHRYTIRPDDESDLVGLTSTSTFTRVFWTLIFAGLYQRTWLAQDVR